MAHECVQQEEIKRLRDKAHDLAGDLTSLTLKQENLCVSNSKDHENFKYHLADAPEFRDKVIKAEGKIETLDSTIKAFKKYAILSGIIGGLVGGRCPEIMLKIFEYFFK